MINLTLSARNRASKAEKYIPLTDTPLVAETERLSGTGALDDPARLKIKITNTSTQMWQGVIHIKLPFKKRNPKFFMPGFIYGRNRGEAPLEVLNEFPRLRTGDTKRPASSWWMVRSDRLSHPTVLTYDEGDVYGLIASPYLIDHGGQKSQWYPDSPAVEFEQYCGYSCSLDEGTIGYTLGYENAPWFFLKSSIVEERAPLGKNCLTLQPGETFGIEIEVIHSQNAHQLTDINKVIQSVYHTFHQAPRKGSVVETTVKELAEAVYRDAYIPEDKAYAGQVFEEPDGSYRMNKIQSLSWTNGLSVSVPILMAANRLKDDAMRGQALEAVSAIVEGVINPKTGLPFDAFNDNEWSIRGWWFDGMNNAGHSGYIMGQSMYYLMKGYVNENELNGVEHQEWLSFVKGVLGRIRTTLNTDFEYPFIFSEKTGASLEYDSLGSSWLLTAQIFFAYLTGDQTDLDQMIRSEQHYYEAFILKLEGYGGPLDVDKATDSEGVLGYVRAVRYLHQLTGDDKYLTHLRDGLHYELSFKFCYNSPIKIDPLKKLNWSSCGGSITSVANPHIHPMSSTIIDEMIYYVDRTGDAYIQSRLIDVVKWGCQSYNRFDKEFDYGKKGWMSERFCHSEGLLTQRYPDGYVASTWFCLMPWASTSIIEGLTGALWDRK